MRHFQISIQYKSILTVIWCLMLVSCNSIPSTTNRNDFQEFWPTSPERARYRYITTLLSSDDIQLKNKSERLKAVIVGQGKPEYSLIRPLDIAVKEGRIYIIDIASPVVHVFDLQRRRYFNFGFRFEGALSRPVSISVDQQGLVYVADRGRNSVIIYDAFGLYIKHIELDGISNELAGMAIDKNGNYLFVVDRGGVSSNTHQILIINLHNNLVKAVGKRGKSQGEYNLPTDIAIDNQKRLFVLDSGNFRVQILDTNGQFIDSWGSAGNGLGQFAMPKSIAIDQDNHIYISDGQFGNVQVFDDAGQLLLSIGKLSGEAAPGLYSLITGIAVDESNYLYVLDQFLGKIDVFRKLNNNEERTPALN